MSVFRNAIPMAALLAMATFATAPEAAREDFLSRFEGSWSGSGTVQVNFDREPREVDCELSGRHDGRSVSLGGTCRAYLIFSRRIGVEVAPAGGKDQYTGTYSGSTVGTARLSGEREGDGLSFTIHWPKEVNGDRTAQMRVINDSGRRLRIQVYDQMGGRGEMHRTTNLVLARK